MKLSYYYGNMPRMIEVRNEINNVLMVFGEFTACLSSPIFLHAHPIENTS